MKKFSVNLGVIIISFAIGLAINSACADSLESSTSSVDNLDLKEFKTLVANLQKEVTNLKDNLNDSNRTLTALQNEVGTLKTQNESLIKRVSSLEQNCNSNNSNESALACGMFQVDGLWYMPTGYICSKAVSAQGTHEDTYNGEKTISDALCPKNIEYDSYGRVVKVEYNTTQGYEYYRISYQYNNKVVTETFEYKTSSRVSKNEVITTYY